MEHVINSDSSDEDTEEEEWEEEEEWDPLVSGRLVADVDAREVEAEAEAEAEAEIGVDAFLAQLVSEGMLFVSNPPSDESSDAAGAAGAVAAGEVAPALYCKDIGELTGEEGEGGEGESEGEGEGRGGGGEDLRPLELRCDSHSPPPPTSQRLG